MNATDRTMTSGKCSHCGEEFETVQDADEHVCPDAPTDRIDQSEVPRTDGDPRSKRIDRQGRSARSRSRITQSYVIARAIGGGLRSLSRAAREEARRIEVMSS